MQLHLDDVAEKVAAAAHAILVCDQAGWHGAKSLTTPPNISLTPPPPRSPELNPQENIGQFMRANSLSNRVFKSYDDIVDHCRYAWKRANRPTLENHVHRPPRMGNNRHTTASTSQSSGESFATTPAAEGVRRTRHP